MSEREGYRRVDVPRERSAQMLAVTGWAFIFTVKDEDASSMEAALAWDRARGIEITSAELGAPGTLAAVHTSARYPLRVPGGNDVMAAGLGWVGVHQGHRRRGLLTSMMQDHFERSLARGEIVSTLFAAEPAIYQRFGYGLACPALSLSLGRGAGLRELEGSDKLPIELADADLSLHADTVIAVLTREGRPGTPMDLHEDLRAFLFLDIESWRNGQEKMRIAIVRDEHGPAAFATFARKSKWDAGGPSGTTTVHQWAAATPEATRRLFSVLSDLDLVGTTTVTNIPMDHPLLHLLVDVRAPQPRRFDNLWVRLLDVPRALEARGYRDSADFTMRVTDPRLAQNDGVWRVRIDDGNASVTRSDAQPDLAISVQDLSAAYLGGVTLSELARSGLVTGDAAAIAAASEALRDDVAPVSAINF